MICDTTSCVLFVYCIWVCYREIIIIIITISTPLQNTILVKENLYDLQRNPHKLSPPLENTILVKDPFTKIVFCNGVDNL